MLTRRTIYLFNSSRPNTSTNASVPKLKAQAAFRNINCDFTFNYWSFLIMLSAVDARFNTYVQLLRPNSTLAMMRLVITLSSSCLMGGIPAAVSFKWFHFAFQRYKKYPACWNLCRQSSHSACLSTTNDTCYRPAGTHRTSIEANGC